MSLKYRTDIDGLRAIAVLAVIFFHTNIPGFSGGFVGVDIFFVISGFLITSIILKDIKEEKFSIAQFYERRIRRIFPALFPVIAFTLVVGAFLFDAYTFKDLGQSITATTLFSSNILFWHKSGYFAAPSQQMPLLHTWSLAVEEQFYIFFPLALVFIHRYLKCRYLLWILITIIVSLGLSIYGVYLYPSETFYLVPTRAWELLAGSILALEVLPNPSSVWLKNIMSITGLCLIIYSVAFYTEITLFPGHNAIAPVLGAWLIIYSNKGEGVIVNKILSARPLVFIGLISYSLYLWHWPLVAYVKYLIFRPLNGYDGAGIILASLAVSILSWKYIEQPFRSKQMLMPDRKSLFAFAGIVMIVASGMGVMIHLENGMGERFELSKMNTVIPGTETNMVILQTDIIPKTLLLGKKGITPSFVLWGDSHAGVLFPAIIDQANKNNVAGYIFSHGGTPPLLGIETNLDKPTFSKAEWNANVLNFIKKNPNIRVVFLAASWDDYNYLKRKNLLFHDIYDQEYKNNTDGNAYLIKGLNRTISALREMGKKIVIIADVPKFEHPVPRIHAVHYRFPSYITMNQFSPSIGNYNKAKQEVFNKIAYLSEIKFIYPGKKIYDASGICRLIVNRKLLYSDSNHLSTAGALFVAPIFNDIFKEMALDAKNKNVRMISYK